ncbi:MAG: fibrobacter succinogenes major paralogous domain-containing protein [Bacteroidota bacterium]
MKYRIFLIPLIMATVLFMITTACKKKDDNNDSSSETTVTDIDGNVYNIITIGTQKWMKENLKVNHYRDGSTIPNVTDAAQWQGLTSGAYCNYNNDAGNAATYGHIYNWYTVADGRKLAPAGWHIPTEAEWNTLISFLGGETIAGGKLKETGTSHWLAPNIGATNETGFTGLAAGDRTYSGNYVKLGETGTWWSSSSDGTYAWEFITGNFGSDIGEEGGIYTYGHSVRCVKD